MIITKDNDAEAIAAMVMASGCSFYDPETATIFNASPCECCGTMSAHGDPMKIEAVTDPLHRALSGYLKVLPYVECTDYNDDGELMCEECPG